MCMQVSDTGIDLIKRHEGFRAQPYLCPARVPTIGYGATYYADGRRVAMTDAPLSEAQATSLLRLHVQRYADGIARYVQVPLMQGQFDALVSWAYNIGLEAARTSTLMRVLNNGNYLAAADQLLRWNRGGGRVLPGLTRRRQEERKLFLESTL